MTTDEAVQSLVRGVARWIHTLTVADAYIRAGQKSGWRNRLPIDPGSIAYSTLLLPEPRRGRRLVQKFPVAAAIEAGIGKKSVANPFPEKS